MSMFSATELADLRAMSGSAMPDTGSVSRPAVVGTTDPATSVFTPNPPSAVYSGPLRVKAASAQDITATFGEELVTLVRHMGVLPHNAPTIAIGDTVTITTSSDPHIDDLTFRVRGVANGSYLVDRRLALEVIE